jgi:hypothetical protein
MAKIVDPDQLNLGTEVVVTTGTKTIQLLVAGNLDDTSPGQESGVTLQAVYSFLKDRWMDQSSLNKFRFPMKAIYEAKFLMENSWNWADAQTRDLIRDAGWREITGAEYATIISLGVMDDDAADQAYYQNVAGKASTGIDVFDKTGRLNEPIQIYDGGSNDYRSYLKAFLREQGKTFDQYNLLVAQGFTALTYIAYRLPLANAADIKILFTDTDISGGGAIAPFTTMTLQYYVGTRFETWDAAQTYVADDVVRSSLGRWYRCILGHTNQEPPNVTYWEVYPGEKQIGTNYYAFNREIRCDAAAKADAEELYAFAQFKLRQTGNVNDDPLIEGYGDVIGRIANPLCYFVGNTLHSSPGVWFHNFDPNITNDLVMWAIDQAAAGVGGVDSENLPKSSTSYTFPFVAAGTLVFNTDLVNDVDAEYWMYFADAGGNLFDSANAILVNDNGGSPIQGLISTQNIAFDFDYTNNAQGGRTPDTDAAIFIVAMGLAGAEWVLGSFTITKATGLTFPVNAPTERNYIA